jgi:hypothetical protein
MCSCVRNAPRSIAITTFALPLLLAAGSTRVEAQAPDRLPRATLERAAREATGGLGLSPAQREAWARLSAEARERRTTVLKGAGISPGDSGSVRKTPLPLAAVAELRAITEWHHSQVLELLNEEQRRAWLSGRARAASMLLLAADSLSWRNLP